MSEAMSERELVERKQLEIAYVELVGFAKKKADRVSELESENAELRQRVQVSESELTVVEFAYFIAFDLLPGHLQEHVIKRIEERRDELRASFSPKQGEEEEGDG